MLSRNYIIGSGLPQEDKNLWFMVLEKMPKPQLDVFDGFIGNREENLRDLTLNLRVKMDAFKTVDEKTVQKLVEEREIIL
jgi:hypothetical protein